MNTEHHTPHHSFERCSRQRAALLATGVLSVLIAGAADAQASWDFGSASLALSVVNLADDDGFEPYQFFGGQYVIPTQPRSAFLTLHTEFR